MTDAPELTLTPTSRLARAEQRRRATRATARGEGAWATPDVLSVSAWFARLRDDALLNGTIDELGATIVIGDDAARELWRAAIDTDVFVGEPRVVELAQRAWRTLHEHRLAAPEGWPEALLSEDSRAFQRWVERFRARCRERGLIDEWTFAAALPGLIRQRRLPLPAKVCLAGFELEPPPLLRAVFDALTAADVIVERIADPQDEPAPLVVRAYADGDAELRAAARWARDYLTRAPDARIGIVIPDLSGRLGRVERIFEAVFDPPAYALGGLDAASQGADRAAAERGEAPWHVSMGPALASWPLVADALVLLGLNPHRIDQPVAGRLLRSPWLTGQAREGRARADCEAGLARHAPYALTLHELIFELKQSKATTLAEALEQWRATTLTHRDAAWPSTWTERFQTELSALGFGRGRPLNSREFQILRRWHDLLEAFAALDGTLQRPLSRRQALARLNERAHEVTFREADPGSTVEILGVQEALGARFDAAWLTTLDRDSWPAAARRDPMIPGPVQQAVPASTSEGCRARALDELEGLRRIAKELHGSYAVGDDEIPRRCTPLLEVEPGEVATEAAAPAPIALEAIAEDRHAPVLPDGDVRGGTAVLRDQSACPFRAFAVHRLGATTPGVPRPGLDARMRGIVLHRALDAFWQALPGRDALLALSPDDREARIEQAAHAALDGLLERHRLALSAAGRRLEQRCATRLLERWLEIEGRRGPFDVVARERKIGLQFGPLTLSGTVDRIDDTPAGAVLIDYKTGRLGRNEWRPTERIADPQLPAYALAMDTPPVALTFARLRPDQLGFDGLARDEAGIDGVAPLDTIQRAWKGIDDFDALLADWKRALDGLAYDFAEGRAAVDPREPSVCTHCHLHALCRIHQQDPLAETVASKGDAE